MARILITGGAGFIGSNLADACLSAGHNVAIVDDLSHGLRGNIHPDAAFYECDVREAELLHAFADFEPEYVYHLAAQIDVRKSLEVPVQDASINVSGGVNTLEACRIHGVRKFIFASTAGAIYSDAPYLPIDDMVLPRPMSHYGASKLAFEIYPPLYERLYGLRQTILRFPNVYGPRQNPHGEAGVCAIFLSKMLRGETPVLYGHGTPLRDFMYVGDITRACLLALEKGDSATLNLGSGRGYSVRELYKIIAGYLEFKGSPEEKPLRAGEVDKIYTTGDLAATVLGWTPEISLEEGVQRTLEWMQSGQCTPSAKL